MHEIKTLDRRTFTLEAALAILSGVTITISGCGGGYSSTPTTPSTPAPTPTPGDKIGSISANHNHEAIIKAAQLTAAMGISLDIRGTADHTHTVELSAADIAAIAANKQVARASSESGTGGPYGDHLHTVTFN